MAQWTTSGSNIFTSSPFVGIGTSNPVQRLTIDGNLELSSTSTFSPSRYTKIDRVVMQMMHSISANWTRAIIGQGVLWNDAASKWQFSLGFEPQNNDFAITRYDNGGSMSFYTGNSTGSSYQLSDQDFQAYKRMSIAANGNVTIGNISSTPNGYKLFVKDGILTERVRVAIQGTSNWSDYVFADNYKLKPLYEVEGFIKDNKHLPDIPCANDVVKNGVDLGAMDALLLRKIEELTLYVIQQQKEIEELKAQQRSDK